MGYVAINVREDDLRNGIFVKAGTGFRGGDFVFHMHEEDYRRGALVKGLVCQGKLIAHTWTDDSGDYRASSYPNSEGTGVVDVEQYGGTKEQYEHHRSTHADYCRAHGWEQGVFTHFPAQKYPDCPACQQGLGWDGHTQHVEGCPDAEGTMPTTTSNLVEAIANGSLSRDEALLKAGSRLRDAATQLWQVVDIMDALDDKPSARAIEWAIRDKVETMFSIDEDGVARAYDSVCTGGYVDGKIVHDGRTCPVHES